MAKRRRRPLLGRRPSAAFAAPEGRRTFRDRLVAKGAMELTFGTEEAAQRAMELIPVQIVVHPVFKIPVVAYIIIQKEESTMKRQLRAAEDGYMCTAVRAEAFVGHELKKERLPDSTV
jgi:hypothetical protein